ncbi:MAG: hypothetical protein ACRDID_03825, partial [Ktedonobacterales bacterium]
FDLPSIGDSPRVWAAYAASHSPQLLGEVYVWGAVAAATMAFLAGLWRLLRRAAPGFETLATLALGSGMVIWAVALAGLAPVLELGYRASALDAATAGSLGDMALLGATLSAFPTAVSVGAFSLVILRSGVAPRWVGWLGILVAAAHLASAGAFAHDGFFSPSVVSVFVAPPLYYLWMLALSLALLLAKARVARVGAAPRVAVPLDAR